MLFIVGALGLAGMVTSGVKGRFACPICNHPIVVHGIKDERTLACPSCQTYLEGKEEMKPVPESRVTKLQKFNAWLPETFHWPAGCPVCGKAVTRTVEVQSADLGATLVSLVSPISVSTVSAVDAPACDKHEDGVGLFRTGKGTAITFRSFAYFKRFCELNDVGPVNFLDLLEGGTSEVSR